MTGLGSFIVYREKTKANSESNYWAGEYNLLLNPKSIPSPFGTPNYVDASGLLDKMTIQELGRASANEMSVAGAYTKELKDALTALDYKDLDLLVFYGEQGNGEEGIAAFIGEQVFTPDEVTDGHVTGTSRIAIKTIPTWIEDNYSVVIGKDAVTGYPDTVTLSAKGL